VWGGGWGVSGNNETLVIAIPNELHNLKKYI